MKYLQLFTFMPHSKFLLRVEELTFDCMLNVLFGYFLTIELVKS